MCCTTSSPASNSPSFELWLQPPRPPVTCFQLDSHLPQRGSGTSRTFPHRRKDHGAGGPAGGRKPLSTSGCSCFSAAEDFKAGHARQQPWPVVAAPGAGHWPHLVAPRLGRVAKPQPGTELLGDRSAAGEVSAPQAMVQQAQEDAQQEQGRSPGESRGRFSRGIAGQPAFPLVPHTWSSQESKGPCTEHRHQAPTQDSTVGTCLAEVQEQPRSRPPTRRETPHKSLVSVLTETAQAPHTGLRWDRSH